MSNTPKFGIFLNTGEQLGANHAEVFDFALEQADLAEILDYHDCWVTEHHFIPFGINSSALTLAGFILGRTKTLRVGTAVTLAPQYHPVQLAEQAAILDQVSGGRFDFGIGRGGYRLDFEVFDIDPARWNDEIETTARTVLDAWTKERSEGISRWATYPSVRVTPRPRSKPHPPLFLATSTPSTIELAAQRGLPLLHFWATPLEPRQKVESAYRAAQPAGAVSSDHVHALIVIVTDDETKVRGQLRDALVESFKSGDWPHVPGAKNRHIGPDGKPVAREALASHAAEAAIVGSPRVVVDKLMRFRETLGANRFVLNMECVADREITLQSIERFANAVLPCVTEVAVA